MEMSCMRSTQDQVKKREQTSRPSFYLIFDNGAFIDENKIELLDELIKFDNKTKLPCHVIGQKVFIHSPKVIFHANTTKSTKTINAEPLAGSHTERPHDSNTEPLEENNTERPQDSNTERPEVSNTEPLEESHTERAPNSNTELLEESHTERPKNSSTEPLEEINTEYPENSNTEPFKESHTEPPQDSITEQLEGSHTKGTEDSNSELLKESPTERPEVCNTEPLEGNYIEVTEDSNTELLEESHTESPQDSITEPLEGNHTEGTEDSNTEALEGSHTERPAECYTERKTVQKLMKYGYRHFITKEEITNIDLDRYFEVIAEAAIGKDVLPIIISFRNGVLTADERIIATSTKYQIPIICFQKGNNDVKVWWSSGNSTVIYKTDTIHPWQNMTPSKDSAQSYERVENISDIRGAEFDILVCNLIVSVCLKEASSTGGQHVKYLTALSKYLFEKGDWTVYKQFMTMCFKKRHLEYIHETVMYKREFFYKTANRLDESQENDQEYIKMDYECNGLLFAALVNNKYLDDALRLVENGQIGIHHILVGCVLLENEINSRKTTTSMKEKLQRFEKTFTEQAINITSYIYEGDKERKNGNINKENELGDNVCHAGRLLLNHGYLRDAINTKNLSYLESDTVQRILTKMFYGTENVHWQMTLCFIVLLVVHMFVLPVLMINAEARPLSWFYKMYKLHFMKVYIHMLGFSVLLIAYAYMLLFDYRVDGITYTDYLIIAWMASFFVDEIKQVFVAFIRGKLTRYSSDWWNLLDWLMIILYTAGMLLKIGEGSGFRITAQLLLVAVFTALCTRLLHLSCMTEFLGRKLVINRKMIKDTFAFMIIITIVMLWYSVSFYALLYPNSEFCWMQIEKILRNGYWMLFGDLELSVTEPECTFNRTIFESSSSQSCPTTIGLFLTPYLKAVYGLIAVVLLLNLLIAIYSDTYTKVQQNATLSWLRIQIDLFEEYGIKTAFPIHLQLLALPGIILSILWFCFAGLKNKISKKEDYKTQRAFPMFVKVFLYEAIYDEKLESTYLAEEKAVPKAIKHIDFSDSDSKQTLTELDTIKKDLANLNIKFTIRQNNVDEKLNKLLKKFKLDDRTEETHF